MLCKRSQLLKDRTAFTAFNRSIFGSCQCTRTMTIFLHTCLRSRARVPRYHRIIDVYVCPGMSAQFKLPGISPSMRDSSPKRPSLARA